MCYCFAAEVITVITNDGRNIVGNLRGFDQTTNLILDECHERIFSPDEGVQQEVLGLYIIRGDNMYVLALPFVSCILRPSPSQRPTISAAAELSSGCSTKRWTPESTSARSGPSRSSP